MPRYDPAMRRSHALCVSPWPVCVRRGRAPTAEDTQQPVASIAVTPGATRSGGGRADRVLVPRHPRARRARCPTTTGCSSTWWTTRACCCGPTTTGRPCHRRPGEPSRPRIDARCSFRVWPTTGRVQVEAGLYVPPDGPRVRLTGTEKGDRSYAVAAFDVRPASNGVFVAFGEGWHGAERAPQEPLREWRWSAGEGRLSFRHPGRDAVLWLELDQPVAAVGRSGSKSRDGPALLATLASRRARGRSPGFRCRRARAAGSMVDARPHGAADVCPRGRALASQPGHARTRRARVQRLRR